MGFAIKIIDTLVTQGLLKLNDMNMLKSKVIKGALEKLKINLQQKYICISHFKTWISLISHFKNLKQSTVQFIQKHVEIITR